jgi:hypothetical protein
MILKVYEMEGDFAIGDFAQTGKGAAISRVPINSPGTVVKTKRAKGRRDATGGSGPPVVAKLVAVR